ncbi:MAG: prenyltransferase [Methanomicrobiales archaeon]|nr:prenyltransferase [Methanomicrobiales archaeon]
MCYGWLPVVTFFYLQSGIITPHLYLMALPISFSVFNVILLNEFPDYEADLATGKANLLVRLGHRRVVQIYIAAAVLGWAAFILAAMYASIPFALILYVPSLGVSIGLVYRMIRGGWRGREEIERLCGANILVNLGTSASLVAGLLL